MKVEDELYVTLPTELCAGRMRPEQVPSVANADIPELITALAEQDIIIDTPSSEKSIEYKINGQMRKATVPLRTTFEDEVRVVGYTLRNKQMELMLRNHGSWGDMFDGKRYGQHGIHCSLKFDGSYEETAVLETAKEIVSECYR